MCYYCIAPSLCKLFSRQLSTIIAPPKSSAVGDIKENVLEAGSKALPSEYEGFDSQQLQPKTALLVCLKENGGKCGKQLSSTSEGDRSRGK